MLAEFLCIAAVYAFAVVYAHGVARRRSEALEHHYVLVAGNHEDRIEWYMRALQSYSRRSGTDVRVTVVLEESGDGTGTIVEKFSRGWDAGVAWQRGGREDLKAATGMERSYRGVAGFRKDAAGARNGIESRGENSDDSAGITRAQEEGHEAVADTGSSVEAVAGFRKGAEVSRDPGAGPETAADDGNGADGQAGFGSGGEREALQGEGTDSGGRWRAERRAGDGADGRDRSQTVWVELSKEEDLKRLPL